jgi:hypothetical protein
VVSVFVAMRNWLGDLRLAVATGSGGDNIGEVRSLTLQGENTRSSLHWL